MAIVAFFRDRFAHPLPGVVVLAGFGLWLLASVWSIVGGILSQYSSMTFTFVGLLAMVIGALGTLTILIGLAWYGVLLLVDYRGERREPDAGR